MRYKNAKLFPLLSMNDYLLGFLLGDNLTVGVMDPNHAAKSFRSQLVTDFVFYIGLLHEARVPKALFNVDDFASDNLVLQLCSPASIKV